jgi:hypothetical protein
MAQLNIACNNATASTATGSTTSIVFDVPSQGDVACGAGRPMNTAILAITVLQLVIGVI